MFCARHLLSQGNLEMVFEPGCGGYFLNLHFEFSEIRLKFEYVGIDLQRRYSLGIDVFALCDSVAVPNFRVHSVADDWHETLLAERDSHL